MRAQIGPQLVIALITFAVAAPCEAQIVEVTPFAGTYRPQSYLFEIPGTCLGGVGQCGTYGVTQQTGFAIGARVTAWTSKRLALDLSFGYSRSRVERPQVPNGLDFSVGGTEPSNITRGSLGLLVVVTPPRTSPASLYLIGALSFVAHGGAAYGGTNMLAPSQTNWGPLLGVGARLRIDPALALRAELENQFYAFTGPGTSNSSRQRDLVLSLGLSATLGRKPLPH